MRITQSTLWSSREIHSTCPESQSFRQPCHICAKPCTTLFSFSPQFLAVRVVRLCDLKKREQNTEYEIHMFDSYKFSGHYRKYIRVVTILVLIGYYGT